MAYYVGDIPSMPLVIEPAEDDLDLTVFDAAETALRDFDGEEVAADFLTVVDSDEGSITIEWPEDDTVFAAAGIYTLSLTLTGSGPERQRLAPIYLVAQDDSLGWYTIDAARADWPEGPTLDQRLYQLLEMAREQVVAYAPVLVADAPIPSRYRTGQLMQARNLWNAGKVDPQNGGMGEDSFVLTPHPLDWIIKQVLRPKRGIPAVR